MSALASSATLAVVTGIPPESCFIWLKAVSGEADVDFVDDWYFLVLLCRLL